MKWLLWRKKRQDQERDHIDRTLAEQERMVEEQRRRLLRLEQESELYRLGRSKPQT